MGEQTRLSTPTPTSTPQPLFLDPRIEGPLADLIDQNDLLFDLVDAMGSPLNVVVPDQVEATLAAFDQVYHQHRLRGTILFANKASRSTAILRRLAATHAGVDVASVGELRHALAAGFTGDRILATGPKTVEYLWLAARVGARIHSDSIDELRTLISLVRHYRLPAVPVVARLSGFDRPGTRILSRVSRFGIPISDADTLLDLFVAENTAVTMVGVGYHVDTSSLEEKAAAAERCLMVLVEAHQRGLNPRIIDVGGGYGVRYVADAGQWRSYTTALTEAVVGRGEPVTWQGHSYGLRVEHGTVRGTLGLYPAAREDAGAGYLTALLSTPGPHLGRPLATLLLEHMVDLDIEPGRALLDQCGLTLTRVAEVGFRAGQVTVRVEANRDDIGFEAGGVVVDPLVLPCRRRSATTACQVYLLGNRCLEHDLITHRLVALRDTPQPGDILAFVNTAGYFADFTATGALRQPIAATVAVTRGDNGVWRWCVDENYWPTAGVTL